MKSKHSEIDQRFLLLFKLDAMELYGRVHDRQSEYVRVFSLKRNRAVFRDIFTCRYTKATIEDLSHCTSEVVEALSSFHQKIDQLYWYLKHTQDMPNMIEDEISRKLHSITRAYELLCLYIDAELGGKSIHSYDELEPNDQYSDEFQLEGEIQEQEDEFEFLQPEELPDFDEDEDGKDDTL